MTARRLPAELRDHSRPRPDPGFGSACLLGCVLSLAFFWLPLALLVVLLTR